MQNTSQNTIPKPWLSFLNPDRSGGSPVCFYDPESIEWTRKIEAQFEALRTDILAFINENENDLKSFYSGQQKWKSFGLYAWGMSLSEERCKKCQKTIDILKQIPGLVTIMVGVMEPNATIKGHHGDTDAIYRCHLPLIVPGALPDIGFQVEEEKRSWVEGKLLVFNDGRFHQAWNNTPHKRIVLIFDVMRPEYLDQTTKICSKVLSSLAIQKLAQKMPFLKLFPSIVWLPIYPIMSKFIAWNLRSKKGTAKSLL